MDKQIRRDERCLSIVILVFNIILSSGLVSAQCGDCDDNDPCTMDLCESMTCQHIPQECSHDNSVAVGSLVNFANSSAPKSPEIPVQNLQVPSASNQAASIPESCDDGNPCTRDSYGANGCVHDPVNCDDGNASTVDRCSLSGCINMPLPVESIKTELVQSPGPMQPEIKNEAAEENTTTNESQSITEGPDSLQVCDDGNPCTTDSHDGTNCVHVPINCDDGNDGTEDSCVDGTCINKPLISADIIIAISENNSTNLSASQSPLAAHHPPNCDDGDPCTEDTFNGKECEHKPKICDDGDPNTYDYCYQGVCHSTTTNCDDGDPCTIDSFNGTACVHTPMNCDDHNACTIDSCDDGKCVHMPKKCDDGNPCTEDYCDSVRGCLHRPVVCGSGRTCIDGVCQRLYYPYAVPYYPPYAAPAASAAPAAQTYTIPSGTTITLPWAGTVTALNALNVENAVAYPGASPLKYVRQLGLEAQDASGGQTSQSISVRSEMIGLSWKDASFTMTLLQPNGVALPVQGDNRNVIHLIGPNYDYYFLRNAAPGSWAIVIQPINPGASGTGFSLINGLVKGASVISKT